MDGVWDRSERGRPVASIVVGLEGHKRSGKDALASRLVERHGFTRVAFADPIRDVLLGVDPVVVPDPGARRYPAPDADLEIRFSRALREHLGIDADPAEAARALADLGPWTGPGVRVSSVVDAIGWDAGKETYPELRRLVQRLGTECVRAHWGDDIWVRIALGRVDAVDGPVVLTDVRFPAEAAAVRSRDGLLVRVDRPGLTATDRHPSETLIDSLPYDLRISNAGTLQELFSDADAVGDAVARELRERTRQGR